MADITVGRPLGIETRIHWSFWLLPALVLAAGWIGGNTIMAIVDTVIVLAIFSCVALHEFGHALAARAYGIRTRDVVLYPIGGIARLERIPHQPGAEIAIALAGPAVNFAIVLMLFPLMVANGFGITHLTGEASLNEYFWTRLLWGNVVLCLFNLIPAFPMDGGRVLRALLAIRLSRHAATDIAVSIGTGFAVIFGVGAVLGYFSPTLLLLAVVLYMTGQSELQAVREEIDRRTYRGSIFGRRLDPVPVAHHADGWEYDAQSRQWTYWLHGHPVNRFMAR
jgi:Zn-dependent protease